MHEGLSSDDGLFIDYAAEAGSDWLPIARKEGFVGQTQTTYADAEGVRLGLTDSPKVPIRALFWEWPETSEFLLLVLRHHHMVSVTLDRPSRSEQVRTDSITLAVQKTSSVVVVVVVVVSVSARAVFQIWRGGEPSHERKRTAAVLLATPSGRSANSRRGASYGILL